MNIPLYKRAGTKLDKMILIKQVTEQVMDQGRVRFLRQEGKTRYWKPVAFRVAQDKVSHALRDGISKPLFHSKSTGNTSVHQRVVATEKKKIDPLALLAATSQMKMPLPDSDIHTTLQRVSKTGTRHTATQQQSEGQMKNPLQNTNMDTSSQSTSKIGGKQQTGHSLHGKTVKATAIHTLQPETANGISSKTSEQTRSFSQEKDETVSSQTK